MITDKVKEIGDRISDEVCEAVDEFYIEYGSSPSQLVMTSKLYTELRLEMFFNYTSFHEVHQDMDDVSIFGLKVTLDNNVDGFEIRGE